MNVSVARKEAQLEMDGCFLIRLIYDDTISYDLVGAASKVLGKLPLIFLFVCF